MSIERNPVTGGWDCSAMKFNRLITRHYLGYTKKEARSEFLEFLEELKS